MDNNNKSLYIIGNGFDIHHKIKSGYCNYMSWLKDKHNGIYAKIVEFYYDADKLEWWNEFEENLGYFDIREKIENIASGNQPSWEDFEGDKWPDVMSGAWDAQDEIGNVISDIKSTFHEWVDSLDSANEDEKINLQVNGSIFINFNYTLTLENLYNVQSPHILHIHGCISDDEYILGHGRKYEEVWDEAQPYIEPFDPHEDPSEYGVDSFDNEITENTKREVVKQVMDVSKPSDKIIENNQKFFEKLIGVSQVFIYGLSFSTVDEPYLDKIIECVSPGSTFEISYFSDKDKKRIENYVNRKNIKAILIKLEDKLIKKQLKLF